MAVWDSTGEGVFDDPRHPGAEVRRRAADRRSKVTRGDEMYVVKSGKVRIFRDSDGDETTLGVLEPGDYFGEMALFDSSPRMANAAAVGDTEVRVVTKAEFEGLDCDPLITADAQHRCGAPSRPGQGVREALARRRPAPEVRRHDPASPHLDRHVESNRAPQRSGAHRSSAVARARSVLECALLVSGSWSPGLPLRFKAAIRASILTSTRCPCTDTSPTREAVVAELTPAADRYISAMLGREGRVPPEALDWVPGARAGGAAAGSTRRASCGGRAGALRGQRARPRTACANARGHASHVRTASAGGCTPAPAPRPRQPAHRLRPADRPAESFSHGYVRPPAALRRR